MLVCNRRGLSSAVSHVFGGGDVPTEIISPVPLYVCMQNLAKSEILYVTVREYSRCTGIHIKIISVYSDNISIQQSRFPTEK